MAGGAAAESSPAETLTFGVEREMEYTGHLTPALHLCRLPRKAFASADETHIRVWGPHGDIAKTSFPQNRRSMVCAMSYCPSFSAVMTAEVDMTIKAYSVETLELLEVFSLAQARKQQGGEKGRSSSKVTALECLPQSLVLVGGDSGAELWRMTKSSKRRATSVGRLEFHLQIDFVQSIVDMEVLKFFVSPSEQRIVIWGPHWLRLYDMELNTLASCANPHGPNVVCCVWVHVVSIINTALLTGGSDGAVNYWNIQTKQLLSAAGGRDEDHATAAAAKAGAAAALAAAAPPRSGRRSSAFRDESAALPASMRLEHGFHGHLRPVEAVCFYRRLERNVRQRLAASCARDGKLKVWSLEQFSVVYTLDFALLDSKASVFPLEPHLLAVSSSQVGGDGGAQRATVSLMRFSAHVAAPFATTNHSPVLIVSQAPALPNLGVAFEEARKVPLRTANSILLVSEDMAVRVVDGAVARTISTLPPPPNSKVQVLKAFLCPVWQLLILWLSSQEIAMFFIPQAPRSDGTPVAEGGATKSVRGASDSTTPLLLRRFSILEVRADVLDKRLALEVFSTVALHHGAPIQDFDAMSPEVGLASPPPPPEGDGDPDWFLLVGTQLGTVQAFRLASILAGVPVWQRLSALLSRGAWSAQRAEEGRPRAPDGYGSADPRLAEIELEHLREMESSRVPGQRPFPKDGKPLRLHARWRGHSYAIEAMESVSGRLLTIDNKHIMCIWHAPDRSCLFRMPLGEHVCFQPHISLVPRIDGDRASDALELSGIVLGLASGALQLVLAGRGGGFGFGGPSEEADVLQSQSTHGDAVLHLDHAWALRVFVSAGRDHVVKIWSAELMLLREIVFPQPLTCVHFRRAFDLNRSNGHGDILVGFASHIERIALSTWSHGVSEEAIAQPRVGFRPAEEAGSALGEATLRRRETRVEMPSAFEELASVQEASRLAQRGQPDDDAETVDTERAAMEERQRQEQKAAEAARARLRAGQVADFRGPPAVHIGTLSGAAYGQQATARGAAPHVEVGGEIGDFQRSDVLDPGDFRAIVRSSPGYYDWVVHPSALVDAPRETAIRGTAIAGSVAMVTSIGVGHLRGDDDVGEDFVPEVDTPKHRGEAGAARPGAGRSSRPKRRPPSRGTASDAHGGDEDAPPQHERYPTGPRRPFARPPSAPRELPRSARGAPVEAKSPPAAPVTLPPVAGAPPQGDVSPIDSGVPKAAIPKPSTADSSDEEWRCKRIGRGVRQLEEPKPSSVVNGVGDSARLLADRGELETAPDEAETNILSKLSHNRTEWLYWKPDSKFATKRNRKLQDTSSARTKAAPQWTAAGRLFNPDTVPPRETVPGVDLSSLGPPPPHLRVRVPMTRAEVTEQRLIREASKAPVPVDFTLAAREYVPNPRPLPTLDSTGSLLSGGVSDALASSQVGWNTQATSLMSRESAPSPRRDAAPRFGRRREVSAA